MNSFSGSQKLSFSKKSGNKSIRSSPLVKQTYCQGTDTEERCFGWSEKPLYDPGVYARSRIKSR